jgi:hypothetical protein
MNESASDFTVRGAIREALKDGEWHNTVDIHARVTRRVPPGIAVRWAEKSHMRPKAKLSTEQMILFGQRKMTSVAMLSARTNQVVETDPPYGNLLTPGGRIRLLPTIDLTGTMTIHEVALALGYFDSTVYKAVEAAGLGRVTTPIGVRVYRKDLNAIATQVASNIHLHGTMRWARYDADFDGLWNRNEKHWELIDGNPVLRKAEPRRRPEGD